MPHIPRRRFAANPETSSSLHMAWPQWNKRAEAAGSAYILGARV